MISLSTRHSGLRKWRWLTCAFCCAILGVKEARAQRIIRLPNSTASVFAANIFAQASYIRAQGSFLVSAAVARKVNAEAAEHEMRNSVLWVNTYFERRRLNREYRAAENPGFLERAAKRHDQLYQVLKRNPEVVQMGDVTDELNWMLRDMLANTSYSMFLSDSVGSLVSSPDNMPLTPEQTHHIRLSEGKNAGGRTLTFRADTAQVLETKWPRGLREESFDKPRADFEEARDKAIADVRANQQLSRESETRLMQAVDKLTEALNEAYPRKRRAESSQAFLVYQSAKCYLQTLALSTYRLIDTQNVAAFDESYRFRGQSVTELVQHMMSNGLEFAHPEPGDEPTYRVLFGAVRALYVQLVPEPAQPAAK